MKVEIGTVSPGYIGSPTGLAAIVVVEDGQTDIHIPWTDHLGSVMLITDVDGNVLTYNNEEVRLTYGPWGKARTADDWQYASSSPRLDGSLPDWMWRGYTGHEHMDEFGLINMNGRLYDPMIGRMLSPDNFVQNPMNTQGYNRYSYVLNNPLKYTDPSGEFLLEFMGLAAGAGFLNGFTSQSGYFNSRFVNGMFKATETFNHSTKINGGLFQYDETYSGRGGFWGDAWQIVSRFTWEAPQTTVGYLYSQGSNILGDVEDVEYFYGGTFVVGGASDGQAVALGTFINISPVREDEFAYLVISQTGYTTLHEYGHYLQSQEYGPLYFLKIGLPSSLGDASWTEYDANTRAADYFQKVDRSFTWVDDGSLYRKLNTSHQRAHWIEHPLFFLGGPIGLFSLTYENWTNPWAW